MAGRLILQSTDLNSLLPLQPSTLRIQTGCNLAPKESITLIRAHPTVSDRFELANASWGLAPAWLLDFSKVQINARAESLLQKPMFRESFLQRRCLIPVTGYYEWKRMTRHKIPFVVRQPEAEPFAIAGIWARYPVSPDRFYDSCALITTPANAFTQQLASRMPAIIPAEQYATWLQTPADQAAQLVSLLRPCPPEQLEAYPVSPLVNDPANKSRRCLEPIGARLVYRRQ